MKRVANWITFILTIASLIGLVVGIAYEIRTHDLLFENYLSTFFGWAWIFAIINYFTRTRIPVKSGTMPPVSTPDLD